MIFNYLLPVFKGACYQASWEDEGLYCYGS